MQLLILTILTKACDASILSIVAFPYKQSHITLYMVLYMGIHTYTHILCKTLLHNCSVVNVELCDHIM